ncbi:MAG TPA: glycoside hydrolase family 30 beta sandwich domain-containing protein, partial [Cyclobacteriaceae bacterium]|nr:glycoside hydrolase family 30 beta sandwich domain-containing protein [Cyclobacteriaceae bacterium]
KNLIIGATRNWSRNVLEWNLAADENFDPHTDDGGCNLCMGALTINSRTNRVSRNVSYYVIAHASKFVNPESRRIGTNMQLGLSNVAFLTPEGKKVLIVLNENSTSTQFSINYKNQSATSVIPAGSVATYVW